MRLNEKQRKLWSDKFMDLANLILATLVFGQVISGEEPSLQLITAGLALYLALFIQATSIIGR